MNETLTKDQSDMVPEVAAQKIMGDVALAKFFDAAELSGSDHAELVALAGALAKLFEQSCTFTATDVLEGVALKWWGKGKF